MKLRHEIALPQDAAFYTTERVFDVSVDNSACGTFTTRNGTFTLAASAGDLAPLLASCPQQHKASLETLSETALRFYRSGGVHSFSSAEYVSMLFMTRFAFGHAFRVSSTNSLERATGSSSVFHGEALAAHTEFLAYGVACHFVATLLGVPIDRFFFITGSGARADFNARVTANELRQAGVSLGALAPTGYIVEVEVKARTGWASFRSTGAQGVALLENLHGKVTRRPGRAFLGVIVALPSQAGMKHTRTKILIADPGEAVELDESKQTELLLEQAVSLLYQHGLWPTLGRALRWLSDIRPLLDHELELRDFVGPYLGTNQYRIIRREHDDRTFNGRIFNDVLVRLGRLGNRGMSESEAEERLRLDDLGQAWYSGVDEDFVKIIENRDDERLRHFGVRGKDGKRDLSGRSAYYVEEEPMADDIRDGLRNALRLALQRW